jgi:hypothetical protein
MIRSLRISPGLASLRFNRQCFRLLQHAKITPENLKYFYRTYRLPRDAFFPLFLRIRKDFLIHRETVKREKIEFINRKMKELPREILIFIEFFREMESSINGAEHHPVWNREIFPGTKKKTEQYLRQDRAEWMETVKKYLSAMTVRYSRFSENTAARLYACFVLQCCPAHGYGGAGKSYVIRYPAEGEIRKRFRTLSKLHHPDTGGQAHIFLEILRAKDLLMEHTRKHVSGG